MKEPVARSDLRLALGGAYYGTLRKLLWLKERSSFAREHCEAILPYSAASHKTPLMRRLRDVDMWMQENKVTNLRLASARVNGIVLHPGQTFSYWYLIGRPTARKGYLPGMLLRNGRAVAGVGGGLCQLSNLIFWMTLHTPLTDSGRTDELLAKIEASNVSPDEKEFLRQAAARHTVFDYAKIADYYAHASKEMQELMEDSALVIIDFGKAIEKGYIRLSDEIRNEYTREYGNEA